MDWETHQRQTFDIKKGLQHILWSLQQIDHWRQRSKHLTTLRMRLHISSGPPVCVHRRIWAPQTPFGGDGSGASGLLWKVCSEQPSQRPTSSPTSYITPCLSFSLEGSRRKKNSGWNMWWLIWGKWMGLKCEWKEEQNCFHQTASPNPEAQPLEEAVLLRTCVRY